MQLPRYRSWNLVWIALFLGAPLAIAEAMKTPIVRIAELQIDAAQLENYQAAVREEIETSIRVEPGVLAIYAVAERENPSSLRFFEIYTDEAAYRAHLSSAHFRKYETATQGMIIAKKLIEATPVALGAKPTAASAPQAETLGSATTLEEMRAVAPALERYAHTTLLGDLWKRPELSARDRSLITLATLITRNQTRELPAQLELALDMGVKPAEISEVITHLAFYSGWGNAMAAVSAAKDVFRQRGIGADQIASALPELLPLDAAAEDRRASSVQESAGSVSPGLVHYTGVLLFRDLWLRPALAPRDRSLVTVSALIASGQFAQITFHLNRAMDNGLTQAQAGEVLTHIAFYAGWPNAFSAVPVMKAVFESRAHAAAPGVR